MTGLRISITMSGTNWKMTDPSKPFQLDVTFVAPTSVPAGGIATVTYNATLSGLANVVPTVVVPPTPPPPPPVVCVRIPPVDPAPGTEVKDFTAKMTDSSGAVWTIAPRVLGSDTVVGQVTLKRNGVTQFGGIEYAYIKGTAAVCVADFKSGPGVSCYVAPGWVPVAGAGGGWVGGWGGGGPSVGGGFFFLKCPAGAWPGEKKKEDKTKSMLILF